MNKPPAWKIEAACVFFARLDPLATRCGYLLTGFGSVLKSGAGRDLDCALLPKFNLAQNIAPFVRVLEARKIFSGPKLDAYLGTYMGKPVHFEVRK